MKCPLGQLKLIEQAIRSVLPAQLKEGTEVYVDLVLVGTPIAY